MEIQELDYQINTINSITNVFKGINLTREKPYQNPVIVNSESNQENIMKNILDEQNNNKILKSDRGQIDENLFGIDIKMETGTGKTYTYTRTILELYQKYGFNKFIVVVPTMAIKEGTKSFIQSQAFQKHLKMTPEISNLNVNFLSLESNKQLKHRGRKYIPKEINEFVHKDVYSKDTVNILLIGMGMLKKTANLFKNDYDENLLSGINKPIDALAATKPIVIMDEPHKFPRSKSTFKYLKDYLNPQLLLRFGATFPDHRKKKDYNNLLVNLDSVEAFNKDLIKGISIFNPIKTDNKSQLKRFKLIGIKTSPLIVTFSKYDSSKRYEFKYGDELTPLDSSFRGIYINDVGKFSDYGNETALKLSNEKVLFKGDSLYSGVFSRSYQELMIDQAINLHFEKEKENFFRSNKYKTLTLFFIDDVDSYRKPDDSKGHLRLIFEEKLEVKLLKEIKVIKTKEYKSNKESEYLDYLEATLLNISLTNGGYFSKDNSSTDDAVKEEVNNIIKDKEKLLKFKDEKGEWITRRFIFSKWTLREGWDNPNIFTIAKLRSSGSDISKLQEVGRGLRLPVDEFGNRAKIGQGNFYLNYLVDFTENDFAEELLNEINMNKAYQDNLKDKMKQVASLHGLKQEELFVKLLQRNYITIDGDIIEDNQDKFMKEYPEFFNTVKKGKILKGKPEKVKINKENFEKIRKIWEKLNQNYFVKLHQIDEVDLAKGVRKSINEKLFSKEYGQVTQSELVKSKNDLLDMKKQFRGSFELLDNNISYGEFLKKVSVNTCVPLVTLHNEFLNFQKNHKQTLNFTNNSINIFIMNFREWFLENFSSKYTYEKLKSNNENTVLTDEDGNVVTSINKSAVGIYEDNQMKVSEKYLYQSYLYDSEIERNNIEKSNINAVTVFGKIPRNSIKIPLFFGGTTSPDFIYLLENESKSESINIIIESKGLENVEDHRLLELKKKESSIKFFEELKKDGVNVDYIHQMKKDDLLSLLNKYDL